MDEKMTAKKKEILETAKELISKHGYENVTINDICEACNISKHTFYYYFESKDQLLNPCFSIRQEIEANVLLRMMEEDVSINKLWIVIDEGLKRAEEAGKSIMREMFIVNLPQSVANFSQHVDDHPYGDILMKLMKTARENDEFRNSHRDEELVRIFMSSLLAIMQIWVMSEQTMGLRDMARTSFEVIFDIREEYRYKRKESD